MDNTGNSHTDNDLDKLTDSMQSSPDIDQAAVRATIRAIHDLDRHWKDLIVGDPSTGTAAVTALSAMGDQRALKALVGAVADNDREVRKAVADVLYNVRGRQITRLLAESLSATHWETAKRAADVLVAIGDDDAIDSLTRALLWANNDAAMRAADALGRIGGPRSIDALSRLLPSGLKAWFVRAQAATALGAIGGPKSVGPLTRGLTDREPTIRIANANALGRAGRREALPALKAARMRAVGGPFAEELRAAIDNAIHAIADANDDTLGRPRPAHPAEPTVDRRPRLSTELANSGESE